MRLGVSRLFALLNTSRLEIDEHIHDNPELQLLTISENARNRARPEVSGGSGVSLQRAVAVRKQQRQFPLHVSRASLGLQSENGAAQLPCFLICRLNTRINDDDINVLLLLQVEHFGDC